MGGGKMDICRLSSVRIQTIFVSTLYNNMISENKLPIIIVSIRGAFSEML